MKIASLPRPSRARRVRRRFPLYARNSGPPEFIKAEIKKQMPEAPAVESVRKTPYNDLYEVVAGGEIFYTNEKATFLSLGPIIDVKTKENLTEARLRQVNQVKFSDAAARLGDQDRARQRLAQDRALRGPELRLLQALRARLPGRERHHRLRVPLPDPRAPTRSTSPRPSGARPIRGKAWIDAMTRDKLPIDRGYAAPARSRRTSRSASRSTSAARRR